MTATTVADPTAPPLAATPEHAPVNVVAIIALVIGVFPSLIGLLALPFAVFFGGTVFVIISPLLAVAAIVVAALGIGISHRIQDRFGGTGGYWFALAGLLLGIVGIYLFLASFSI